MSNQFSRPSGDNRYFPKVKEARQALADKALEIYNLYDQLIREALAAQEFKVAADSLQFLLKHMPKDEDGVSVLDPSVDRAPKFDVGEKGPSIQIGIALGGVKQAPALPPSVIDVTEDNDTSPDSD